MKIAKNIAFVLYLILLFCSDTKLLSTNDHEFIFTVPELKYIRMYLEEKLVYVPYEIIVPFALALKNNPSKLNDPSFSHINENLKNRLRLSRFSDMKKVLSELNDSSLNDYKHQLKTGEAFIDVSFNKQMLRCDWCCSETSIGQPGPIGPRGTTGTTGAAGSCCTGAFGTTGTTGKAGTTGTTGSAGTSNLVSAQYVQLGSQPLTVAAGQPFTFTNAVLTSSGITASTAIFNPPFVASGTIFTLVGIGRYEVNYQTNYPTPGGVVLYLGSTIPTMLPLPYTMIGKAVTDTGGQVSGTVIIETTTTNSFLAVCAAPGNSAAIVVPPNSSTTNQSATTLSFKKIS